MEEPKENERLSLKNAFTLLAKVLSEEDNQFTKEDWQMLQVAQFLVSKEKFLRRDSDNTTLHFGFPQSVLIIDDLCQSLYDLAKYIYDHDPLLVVDSTKILDYKAEIPKKFRELSKPSFDEALIIVNMVRNSIVHGASTLDFDSSVLRVDNILEKHDDTGVIQFKINVDIPLSFLSRIDLGHILKKNHDSSMAAIFNAIAEKNYRYEDGKVIVDVIFEDELHSLSFTNENFMMLMLAYERNRNRLPSIVKPAEEIDVEKYKKIRFVLQKKGSYKYMNRAVGQIDYIKLNKEYKDLLSIMELINNDHKKVLDPIVSQKFIALMESNYLPANVKMEAVTHFSNIFKSIDYHENTEESFSSISYVFGSFRQEKTIDFIALYNYMTFLFADCPLKEGNALFTEFLDFSTIAVDPNNTDDRDISEFYLNVSNIISESLSAYNGDNQYNYVMPCINLYAKTLRTILNKLKTRNNAYIRHIRNSVEHSNMSLAGDVVELRDYVENGSVIDRTFRSRISMDSLVQLSLAYSSLYNINDVNEYISMVNSSDNDFLSFTFNDLFRELEKGLDPKLIYQFKLLLKDLHESIFEEEFSYDANLAEISIRLANTSHNLSVSGKSRGGKK